MDSGEREGHNTAFFGATYDAAAHPEAEWLPGVGLERTPERQTTSPEIETIGWLTHRQRLELAIEHAFRTELDGLHLAPVSELSTPSFTRDPPTSSPQTFGSLIIVQKLIRIEFPFSMAYFPPITVFSEA